MSDKFTIEIVSAPVYEIELTGRGPQGFQGPKGDTGATGPAGPAGPQGPQGEKGDTALTFNVGTTETLSPDTPAYVVNIGTNEDIVLDFGVPKGNTGASGKGVDIGTVIQSLSKVAPDGFVHTWGESITQEENPELYQACLDGTLPTVNANNGGVSTIYAPNGIFKLTPGTNTFEINANVVMELAKIGGVVNWNGSYNPQPTGNLTLASFRPTVLTHIMMFTEGGLNESHFRLIEGSYLGKLSEHPEYSSVNDIYFNTTDKTYYIYEGGDWNQYGAEGVGYIYLGAVLFSGDASTMTWGSATFYPNPDVTTTGLSEYDQQLVANKGNCGYFGLDTTELSVRVPTMQNIFLEENDTEVGSYKAAMLPQHYHVQQWVFQEGTRPVLDLYNAEGTTGTLKSITQNITHTSVEDGNKLTTLGASGSPVYQDNFHTVQPEAIAVYFYVCVSKYTSLEVGPYFTPHVDSDGNLTWTNNGGLINPPSSNIRGPQGDPAFTLAIGQVSTLEPNQQAIVTNVGTEQDQVWDIGIPRGETGDISNKANIGLDNLNNEGMNIANWSTNVTNCITEIPQDIKLELNDGVLTLKAGSKVYEPDSTEINIERDYSITATYADGILFYDIENNALGWRQKSECYSQDVAPTATQYMLWHDTANNSIKVTADTGATWTECALPVGTFTANATQITSIDQIFNGFGYIGSTYWVNKGVKALLRNGKNEDGTYKNIEFTVPKLQVHTTTSTSAIGYKLIIHPDLGGGCMSGWLDSRVFEQTEEPTVWSYGGTLWINPETNISKYHPDDDNANWVELPSAVVGIGNRLEGGKVSFPYIKQPFRAVDYSEFNLTPHITETYQNGTSGYIVYSNGYCEQWGRVNINFTANRYNDYTITLLKPYKNTDYNILAFAMDRGDIHNSNIAYYTITSTNWVLRTYTVATQNDKTACWRTCGYIA